MPTNTREAHAKYECKRAIFGFIFPLNVICELIDYFDENKTFL